MLASERHIAPTFGTPHICGTDEGRRFKFHDSYFPRLSNVTTDRTFVVRRHFSVSATPTLATRLCCLVNTLTAFEMSEWRRMLRTHGFGRTWEDWYTRRKGILEQIKHRKLSKYCHWKRNDSVVLATIEGETEAKCFPGRRRTGRIDDVRRFDRRWHERVENKCNGKKIRVLIAGCL